jgi:putative transposase
LPAPSWPSYPGFPGLSFLDAWHAFLRNHTVWACDFLQTYDVWFRPIFAFFIVDVNTKRVVHVAMTRAPTQEWTAQQLRNALPFDGAPQFIIRDRDDKFGAEFERVAKGAGTRVIRSAVRAPLINSICERFLGTVRRECLDHVLILREQHLRSVLEEFCFNYFNIARPHQGLAQGVPAPTSTESRNHGGTIMTAPVLGGLHHDYRRAA